MCPEYLEVDVPKPLKIVEKVLVPIHRHPKVPLLRSCQNVQSQRQTRAQMGREGLRGSEVIGKLRVDYIKTFFCKI